MAVNQSETAGLLASCSFAFDKGTDVTPDFIKGIDAAHMGIRFTGRAIHREAIFVQSRIDQRLAAFAV